MLCFLLDEHISPIVAEQATRKFPGIVIKTLHGWRGGGFLANSDNIILNEAARDGLTLVSYDLRTIPRLLKDWIEQGIDHAGVVFVDEKTLAPREFGGLVRAIGSLWKSERKANWKNRVVFLRRV